VASGHSSLGFKSCKIKIRMTMSVPSGAFNAKNYNVTLFRLHMRLNLRDPSITFLLICPKKSHNVPFQCGKSLQLCVHTRQCQTVKARPMGRQYKFTAGIC
jgi:Na+-transporting NADH:ubiquinone oxidoreductase subunit NqrF